MYDGVVAGASATERPLARDAGRRGVSARAALARLVRAHPALTAVLALGALLRLAVAVAYRPALMWDDSWAYLNTAFRNLPVSLSGSRPSGYPLLVRILTGDDLLLAGLVTAQHLAGLAVGALAYVLALRLGVRRWVATVLTAVILLDSYALTLEQTMMPETLFTLALLLSAYLLITRRSSWPALAASGGFLAIATTIRTAALFAVPVWLWYLLGQPRNRRGVLAAVLALALPLLAYCSFHALVGRGFMMVEADGWFLYGRVAAIADCRTFARDPSLERLCDPRPFSHRHDPTYYVFLPTSPAVRAFEHPGGPDARKSLGSNATLRRFSLSVIRHRPGRYASLVADDYVKLFTGRGDVETAIVMPSRPRTLAPYSLEARRNYLPGYAPEVHRPAGLLLGYQRVAHAPLWLAGLAALVLLLAAPAMVARRVRRAPHVREGLLLGWIGVATSLGAVATVSTEVRYLVPAVPFLLTGALVVLASGGSMRQHQSGNRPNPSGEDPTVSA